MKKKEFVALVAQKIGKSQKEALIALNAVIEAIEETVSNQDSITFVGFGKFKRKQIPSKTGKIPGSKKTYTTEEKYVPQFSAGAVFKKKVSQK